MSQAAPRAERRKSLKIAWPRISRRFVQQYEGRQVLRRTRDPVGLVVYDAEETNEHSCCSSSRQAHARRRLRKPTRRTYRPERLKLEDLEGLRAAALDSPLGPSAESPKAAKSSCSERARQGARAQNGCRLSSNMPYIKIPVFDTGRSFLAEDAARRSCFVVSMWFLPSSWRRCTPGGRARCWSPPLRTFQPPSCVRTTRFSSASRASSYLWIALPSVKVTTLGTWLSV